MNSIVFLILLTGIIMVVIGFVKSEQICPPPIVQYKYIPRTFEEEQELTTPITSVFGKMFSDASAWQQYVGFENSPRNTRRREKLDLDSFQ